MGIRQRLRRLASNPSYVFGRFLTVRRLYALRKRFRQPPPTDSAGDGGFYSFVDVEKAKAEMKRDAYTVLPQLPEGAVSEIMEFAKSAICEVTGVVSDFRYIDVSRGRLPDGRALAMAVVKDASMCPAVAKIQNDETLFRVVAHYLGYAPTHREVRLYWSFAGELTDEERRAQNQTIDYHFDVHSYNFAYLHLYVTDTDADSGAHVLVRGSHTRKPFRWLLGSARRSDAAIRAVYPAEDIVVLTGPGGTGVLEDTSCYHKALVPRTADRLLLQIRYH